MNIDDLETVIREKMSDITSFVRDDVPTIVRVEAINHFKESFDREAAPDGEPWAEVERRKPESPWYGFSAGEPKNFSDPRTSAKILTGETGELRNAFSYRSEPGMVVVINKKPYAAVHNFGLPANIFGKKPFVMKQRKFMGYSKDLQIKIEEKIYREMINILKK